MTSSSSFISSEIEEKFNQYKQLRWEDLTPDRIAYISKEIEKSYVPSVGIQAADMCRILYGYYPTRKMYEGIAYHLFDLVVTKDGKGHVFFIKKSDIGSSTFPVVSSVWHNLDTITDEEDNSIEISNVRNSLETQWDNSSVDKGTLSTVLSSMLKVCSKLSELLGKTI